jgi:flagellar basal-body rod modification protein FlgD
MTIDATSSSTAASAAGSPQTGLFTAEQSRDMFLRLLVNQVRNQDPLNPQDPTAFVSQLAEFSSLEQLLDMRESLQAIRTALLTIPESTEPGTPGTESIGAGEIETN